MENSGGIQASLAGRYATALFGLASDEQQVDAVGRSLDSVEAAMTQSADFRALVTSPLIGRADAGKTIRALVPALGLDSIEAAMAESADFRALVTSPLVSRADAGKTIRALVPALGLDPITGRFLGVLADNGRLSELKSVIRIVRQLASGHRGETRAEVTSARPLSDDQIAALKTRLKARVGSDVAIDAKVDPALFGGIVVRLGSQMIDASIATKLNTLAMAMKG